MSEETTQAIGVAAGAITILPTMFAVYAVWPAGLSEGWGFALSMAALATVIGIAILVGLIVFALLRFLAALSAQDHS